MAIRFHGRHAWCVGIGLALLAQCCGSRPCRAGDALAAKDFTDAGPYCGVYCLYAALGALGKDVDCEELVSSEFIGSFQGSSSVELERAAAHFGAQAVTMTRLTADMLRLSPHPIILHVKPVVRSNVYSHWVLFLGMEDGRARILDPPRPVELVPLADVLARWDGTGVVVADRAASTARFVWIARGTFAALAAIGMGVVWLVRRRSAVKSRTQTSRGRLRRDLLAAASVLGISAMIGFAWHGVSPEGFLSNRSAVASVVANFHSTFLPHLTADELQGLLAEGGAIVVDARRPQDYRRGHIDGAINLTVASSLAERERALGDVAKSARIVLYCQSEGCNWASELANVLAANGYENLALFTGGWREWSGPAQQKEGRER